MVSIKNDTRNFCTPRQAPDADIIQHPCVDDTLKFVLPPCPRIQRRDVLSSNGQRFELWSPNSTQNPYYPGLEGRPVREHAENEEHRRFDGSLGRFDPTYAPLHFDKDRPWLGFVRRSFTLGRKDNLEKQPEHMVVSMVWESAAAPSKFGGRLQQHFIQNIRRRQAFLQESIDRLSSIETSNPWSDRPTYPSAKDLEGLNHIRMYGDAVDFVTSVQRGLKLQAAWIEMTNFVTANFGLEKELAFPVDDRRVGVWINGSDQANALWLLRAGVPCFVIHEYIADVDFPLCRPSIIDHRREVFSRNFSDATDMEKYTHQHYNPYLGVAHQNRAPLAVTLPPNIPSRQEFPKELRSLSASWRQQPSAETNSVELEEYVPDPQVIGPVVPISSPVIPEHIPLPKDLRTETHSSPKSDQEVPVLTSIPNISAARLAIQNSKGIIPSCYLRCRSLVISFESLQAGLENMKKLCSRTPPIVRAFRTSKEDAHWFWVQVENENVAWSIGEYFFANRKIDFAFATQSEFDDALQNCCSPTMSNISRKGVVQPKLRRDRNKDLIPIMETLLKMAEKEKIANKEKIARNEKIVRKEKITRKDMTAVKGAHLAGTAAVPLDGGEDTPAKKPFRRRRGGQKKKVNRLLEQSK